MSMSSKPPKEAEPFSSKVTSDIWRSDVQHVPNCVPQGAAGLSGVVRVACMCSLLLQHVAFVWAGGAAFPPACDPGKVAVAGCSVAEQVLDQDAWKHRQVWHATFVQACSADEREGIGTYSLRPGIQWFDTAYVPVTLTHAYAYVHALIIRPAIVRVLRSHWHTMSPSQVILRKRPGLV